MSEKAWKSQTRNFEAAMAHGDLDSVRAIWNTRHPDSLNAQAISWYLRACTINHCKYKVLVRIARQLGIVDVLPMTGPETDGS